MCLQVQSAARLHSCCAWDVGEAWGSLLCTVSPLCSQLPGCEVESRCLFALRSPPPSSAPSSVLISRFQPGPGTATDSSSPMWVPVLTTSDAPLWGSVCRRRCGVCAAPLPAGPRSSLMPPHPAPHPLGHSFTEEGPSTPQLARSSEPGYHPPRPRPVLGWGVRRHPAWDLCGQPRAGLRLCPAPACGLCWAA